MFLFGSGSARLGNPDVFLNTTGDIHILPRVLDAAVRFQARPSNEQMEDLLARQEMTPIFPLT